MNKELKMLQPACCQLAFPCGYEQNVINRLNFACNGLQWGVDDMLEAAEFLNLRKLAVPLIRVVRLYLSTIGQFHWSPRDPSLHELS
jgi:hypothetical protein